MDVLINSIVNTELLNKIFQELKVEVGICNFNLFLKKEEEKNETIRNRRSGCDRGNYDEE